MRGAINERGGSRRIGDLGEEARELSERGFVRIEKRRGGGGVELRGRGRVNISGNPAINRC